MGQNLYQEDFAFQALNYDDRMIVAAPQLSDWGETSAEQTIALTEYLLDAYNIDPDRVYANGYSGGGETMSRVLGMRPDLFTAYLQCSSSGMGPMRRSWKRRFRCICHRRGGRVLWIGAHPGAYDQLHATNAPSDGEYFKILQPYLTKGRIGMFILAKCANTGLVKAAAAAGLHFLRVGANAGDGATYTVPSRIRPAAASIRFLRQRMKRLLCPPSPAAATPSWAGS